MPTDPSSWSHEELAQYISNTFNDPESGPTTDFINEMKITGLIFMNLTVTELETISPSMVFLNKLLALQGQQPVSQLSMARRSSLRDVFPDMTEFLDTMSRWNEVQADPGLHPSSTLNVSVSPMPDQISFARVMSDADVEARLAAGRKASQEHPSPAPSNEPHSRLETNEFDQESQAGATGISDHNLLQRCAGSFGAFEIGMEHLSPRHRLDGPPSPPISADIVQTLSSGLEGVGTPSLEASNVKEFPGPRSLDLSVSVIGESINMPPLPMDIHRPDAETTNQFISFVRQDALQSCSDIRQTYKNTVSITSPVIAIFATLIRISVFLPRQVSPDERLLSSQGSVPPLEGPNDNQLPKRPTVNDMDGPPRSVYDTCRQLGSDALLDTQHHGALQSPDMSLGDYELELECYDEDVETWKEPPSDDRNDSGADELESSHREDVRSMTTDSDDGFALFDNIVGVEPSGQQNPSSGGGLSRIAEPLAADPMSTTLGSGQVVNAHKSEEASHADVHRIQSGPENCLHLVVMQADANFGFATPGQSIDGPSLRKVHVSPAVLPNSTPNLDALLDFAIPGSSPVLSLPPFPPSLEDELSPLVLTGTFEHEAASVQPTWNPQYVRPTSDRTIWPPESRSDEATLRMSTDRKARSLGGSHLRTYADAAVQTELRSPGDADESGGLSLQIPPAHSSVAESPFEQRSPFDINRPWYAWFTNTSRQRQAYQYPNHSDLAD
ncbi:hypothetical protein HGRIS_000983 [Hohenbuehelia grisea]|uniref:Uncharacterized protein n=1 Tax=Hohenbuehelia grisea TaxID=104357 RepID=A0ABR3IQD1_9AGAR